MQPEPSAEVLDILRGAEARHLKRVNPDQGGHKSLAAVVSTFRRWLYLPDPGTLETVLATVAANRMDGDPVWLLNVGPPGSGKTEQLAPLVGLPNVHPAATLTEAALLSGTPTKDKAQGARGGLLRAVGEFGFILLKDFTSILAMHRDTRAAMLAALREIFDGSWTRHVGVDGGKTLHWEGKLALIAGCTPAIDSHHGVIAAMGERFLMLRMPVVSADELAYRSLQHPGDEREMRRSLSAAVAEFFRGLDLIGRAPEATTEEIRWLVALSTLVVRCRSAVERDSHSREVDFVPDAEAPGRLARCLAQLLGGMKVVGIEPDERRRLLRQVGFDSMPALRRRALDFLASQAGPVATTDVAIAAGHPTQTMRRALEDLTCHSLLQRTAAGSGKADLWELTDWTRNRLAAIGEAFPKCQ